MTRIVLEAAAAPQTDFAELTPNRPYGAALAIVVLLGAGLIASSYLWRAPDTLPGSTYRVPLFESTGRAHLTTSQIQAGATQTTVTLPLEPYARELAGETRPVGGWAQHGRRHRAPYGD